MSRTHRALVMLALGLALATTTTAAAAEPSPPTIEDQHDRQLRHLEAEQAARTQAAVELSRSMERSFVPAPPADVAPAQPAAAVGPVAPGRGLGVLVVLLLGLAGGLVGGFAAMAGWTATTRRRLHRTASAA